MVSNVRKTKHITLEGRVQGVGMRWTVDKIAHKFEVTGYVRNLYNGFVEIVAQGDEQEIEIFLDYIKQNAPGRITKCIVTDLTSSAEYEKFKVKYF